MIVKRLLALELVATLALGACTADGATSTGTGRPPQVGQGGTLSSVLANGVVRAGIRNDFPPISYIDEDGNWVGFDLDLAQELAGRLGVQLERVAVNETTRITFLQTGRIDMAVASMNHTRSREEAVDFTQTYFWGTQTFLIRRGEYEALEDLFGVTVAMNKGSSAIEGWRTWAVDHGGAAGNIVEFDDKQEALQALKSGAVDAYGEDDVPLLALANGDPNLVLIAGGFNPVRYGIGVPENDSDWRDALNLILQDIYVDGTFQAIYERWFGPDTATPLALHAAPEIWP